MADVPPGIKDLINAAQRALHGDNRLSAAQVAQIQAQLASMQGMVGQINELGMTRRTAVVGGVAVAGSMAGRGGQQPAPMNAPPAGQVGYGVQPGSPGVVVAHFVIITGSAGGWFIYNGTPGPGNPPIAWGSNGTTDPYGNTLPNSATLGIASTGTFQAGNTIINRFGEYGYGGAPSSSNLNSSWTPGGNTDPFGNGGLEGFVHYDSFSGNWLATAVQSGGVAWFRAASIAGPWSQVAKLTTAFTGSADILSTLSGIQAFGKFTSSVNSVATAFAALLTTDTTNRYQVDSNGKIQWGPGGVVAVDTDLYRSAAGVLTTDGSLGVGNLLTLTTDQAAPSAPATGSTFYANSGGNPAAINQAGFAGALPLVQSDTTTLTNNNLTGANRVSAIYTIPANDLKVGTEYCIEVPFLATMAGVAADTLELGLSIDGSTSYSTNNTINGAIVGGGVSINGVLRVYLKCVTTGAGGTINTWTDGSVNQTSATTTFANSGGLVGNLTAAAALDTTASHTIRVNSTWAVSNATQALTVRGSKCTRTGP